MNDSEVTMHDTRPPGDLTVYRTALEAAATAIALVRRVPSPLKSLADQVIRCASSVPANLNEGHGRSGRNRIHHWRIAFASAKEVDAHLSLLARAGAVDAKRAAEALDLFDQVRAMTWRLLHPKR
ncbi:MAG TPA: four helix bundle protein [Methylomirabilota bacterium]|nr:four helix bundle protein [Methylomirabilota bacterium]